MAGINRRYRITTTQQRGESVQIRPGLHCCSQNSGSDPQKDR